jgi:hypothetical protein
MSVVLTDMDIPECCQWECQLCNGDGGACILGVYDKKANVKIERPNGCPLKSIDGLLADIYNMVDDSIVYGHLVNLTSGRKDIEETVTAIGDDYRKIVMNVIKKYCEAGDTDA